MAAKTAYGGKRSTEGPRRYGKGFRHASDTVRKSVDKIAGKKGFAESDVLLRWAEIVGDALAATCQAVKVHYGANRNLGATLIVQADSGRAPEVSHLSPKIIERVNRFYGYRAINRLKVTQSTGYSVAKSGIRGFAEGQTGFAGPEPAISNTVRREASDLAEGIENPELRAALTLMGSNVLSRSKTTKPGA